MSDASNDLQAALDAERAIRDAAREGNQLIAGGRARVDVTDDARRIRLRAALARMGARLTDGDADFLFVDGPGALVPDLVVTTAGIEALPSIVVRVPGGAEPAREADARSRIEWARAGMPATRALTERLRALVAGEPIRLGISLVLEPKTAAFASALARAGIEVAVFSAVSETDPDVAAALATEPGVTVFAPGAAPADPGVADEAATDRAHAAAILQWAPDYLIDDGSHLIRLVHTEHREALRTLRAASEETTSGVRPLHEAHAAGALRVPVFAANDARTKSDFDNLIGTGQSCVFAIADSLDDAPGYRGIADTRWAVIGYGPVGVGVARFAAALGAHVTIVEQDPVRALAALHDGHEASGAPDALATADVVVSATGVWHTVTAAGFAAMRTGTAVAVAGGIDDELALDDLRAAGWTRARLTERIAAWSDPAAERVVRVLADGGGVNYTAGEGNPIEVMDLSFATQVQALIHMVDGPDADPGVQALTREDEDRVARAALAGRGGGADPAADRVRPGGAAQDWTVHRYRGDSPDPLA